MLERTSQKILVVVGIIAVLGAFGYFVFNNTEVVTSSDEIIQQDAVGQDILTLAEKLNSVNIDDHVFTSAVFLSLVDRDIPISPENQGRANPFAVIGSEGGAGVTTKSTLPILPPR